MMIKRLHITSLLLSISIFALGITHAIAAMTPTGKMIPVPEYIEAEALVKSGDLKAAIPLLNKTLQQHPTHASAWNLLGYSYRKMGDLDKAEKYYEGALTVNPKHLGALNYMGHLFIQTGRPEKAQGLLDRLKIACPSGCPDLDSLEKAVQTGVAGKY